MKQKTGIVKIRVNSQLVRSKKGAKLTVGGVKREVDEDAYEAVYSESKIAPRVEFTVQHTSDFSVQDFQSITEGTITFECDNGVIFVLEGAVYLEGGELSDGDVSFTFAATTCTEQLGSTSNA
ncbi:phage tail tube protein [Desulfarculus baarsii]